MYLILLFGNGVLINCAIHSYKRGGAYDNA